VTRSTENVIDIAVVLTMVLSETTPVEGGVNTLVTEPTVSRSGVRQTQVLVDEYALYGLCHKCIP
jgi:hypothetical protein